MRCGANVYGSKCYVITFVSSASGSFCCVASCQVLSDEALLLKGQFVSHKIQLSVKFAGPWLSSGGHHQNILFPNAQAINSPQAMKTTPVTLSFNPLELITSPRPFGDQARCQSSFIYHKGGFIQNEHFSHRVHILVKLGRNTLLL